MGYKVNSISVMKINDNKFPWGVFEGHEIISCWETQELAEKSAQQWRENQEWEWTNILSKLDK